MPSDAIEKTGFGLEHTARWFDRRRRSITLQEHDPNGIVNSDGGRDAERNFDDEPTRAPARTMHRSRKCYSGARSASEHLT
jgi:hypothetical protein